MLIYLELSFISQLNWHHTSDLHFWHFWAPYRLAPWAAGSPLNPVLHTIHKGIPNTFKHIKQRSVEFIARACMFEYCYSEFIFNKITYVCIKLLCTGIRQWNEQQRRGQQVICPRWHRLLQIQHWSGLEIWCTDVFAWTFLPLNLTHQDSHDWYACFVAQSSQKPTVMEIRSHCILNLYTKMKNIHFSLI